MLGRDETLLALTLPCAPTASAVVREELSHHEDLGWVLGDAILVASELVNNAVMHSGGQPHHDLQVTACRDADRLLISVRDPGLSGWRAGPVPRTGLQMGGWGMQIVDALCERWGEERDDGYLVWAQISLPADGASSPL